MRLGLDYLRAYPPYRAPPPTPPWRWLWPLLGAGVILRLILAYNTEWILRPDEQIQYLEQAHRIVFGYGIIPWEYRVGARNWMLTYPAILALYLAKGLGLEQPWNYDLVVKTVYVLISMVIPWSMYHFMRRLSTEMAARAALVLGLVWFELLVFAHRPLSEPLATVLIFAVLGLAHKQIGLVRIGLCGFLLGVAFSLRVAYAPLCAVVGFGLLFSVGRKQQLALCAGGIVALLLWGLVDKLTWGGWYESIINYTKAQIAVKPFTQSFNTKLGVVVYLPALVLVSGGVFLAAFLFGLYRLQHNWWLLSLFLAVLLPHAFYSGAEFTNIFVAVPILLCLAAAVWGQTMPTPCKLNQLAHRHKLGICYAVAACLFGGLGFNPVLIHNYYSKQLFFHKQELLNAMDYFARLPDYELKAVLLRCGSMLYNGGYYRVHKYVPMIENAVVAVGSMKIYQDNYLFTPDIDDEGNLIREYTRQVRMTPIAAIVSHILSCDGKNFDGFREATRGNNYRILVNNHLALVTPPEPEFHFRFNLWHRLEKEMQAKGEFFPKEVYLRKPATSD